MRSSAWVIIIAAVLWIPVDAVGQAASRTGRRSLLPRDTEIALARSAAPASVSANARVLALTDTGFIAVAEGSASVTCIVNRSWPASLEPHCFDAEASATIMQIEIRRTVMFHQGRSADEVDGEIAAGIASGRFRLPRRPAMSWMMSEEQKLIDDDGRAVGKWRPHIMIYYPFLTSAETGFAATPDIGAGMVSDSGTATANFMIVVPSFVTLAQRK